MPILQGKDTFTQRIYNGTVEIRRVYLGDTLQGGLYDVTYHYAQGNCTENPKEYVWGIADIELPKPTGSNQQYYTKFNGGYEDKTYVTAIPAITKDLHKDLELYAKWTQRKYTYSGTYTGTTQEGVGGGGGSFSSRDECPTPSDDAYPGSDAATGAMPNCTWYCRGRAYEAWGSNPIVRMPDAGSGPGVVASGGEYMENDRDFTDGDILVGTGHVAFVEGGDTVSESYGTENLNRSGTAEDMYDRYHTSYRFGHTASASSHINNPGTLGTYLGIIRCTSGGGGHYETVTHTENVVETDCPNQKPPTQPTAPQGSWSQFNQYTYTRDYNYQSNDGNAWGNQTSGGDTSGSDGL